MPIVNHKGKTFTLRWLPEWDIKLLVVAIKFRKDKFVDWITAEAQGYLTGLPVYLSRRDLSHRLSFLVNLRYNPKAWKRKIAYNKTRPHQVRSETFEKKMDVFKRDISDPTRRSFGHKPKERWDENQRGILLFLVKKYPKGKMSVDWVTLMKDPLIKALPFGYTLARLRSYYWRDTTKNIPRILERRRKSALEYKKKNYKKYRASQDRNKAIIKNTVNTFLLSKIDCR